MTTTISNSMDFHLYPLFSICDFKFIEVYLLFYPDFHSKWHPIFGSSIDLRPLFDVSVFVSRYSWDTMFLVLPFSLSQKKISSFFRFRKDWHSKDFPSHSNTTFVRIIHRGCNKQNNSPYQIYINGYKKNGRNIRNEIQLHVNSGLFGRFYARSRGK